MRTAIIYGFCDPGTENVRYIGATVNLKGRINTHIYQAKNAKRPNRKDNWIRKLIKTGKAFDVTILKRCNVNEAEGWEIYFYNLFKQNDLLCKPPIKQLGYSIMIKQHNLCQALRNK